MKITYKQEKWLESRGDRTIDDVKVDKNGLYVLMENGEGGEMKVYLADDDHITIVVAETLPLVRIEE